MIDNKTKAKSDNGENGGRPLTDLTGRKFGRLTVLAKTDSQRQGRWVWECVCECGSKKLVCARYLGNGQTKSCGCLRRERSAESLRSKKKPISRRGLSRTPEYNSYTGMLQRCYDKNYYRYDRYGGRGVKVCDRWLGEQGFLNFYADMGSKPSPKHSLDRFPNNHGNYEPANCRWATQKQQIDNRELTPLTYNGVTKTSQEWAKDIGITYQSFMRRLAQWPPDKTFSVARWKRKN